MRDLPLLGLTIFTAALFASYQARAAASAMSCEFIDGTKGGGYASGVNRLLVNEREKLIEFSIAQSIGTESEVNYTFSNVGENQLVMHRVDNVLTAAGIRYDVPFSIRIDYKSGIVIWQYIDGTSAEFSRYKCAR